MKKFLNQVNFENKKVLVRVDFNVPMEGTTITSNARIKAALPTLDAIFNKNPEKVILFSHLGRVKSPEDKIKRTLRPVAKELAYLAKRKVIFSAATKGPELLKRIEELGRGEILLVENTRFEDLNDKAESKNLNSLGKYWASLGDVFVNDAFGTVHRAHASNVGIATYIKESCIGLLVQKELKMLSKAVYHSEKPIIAIIGGAKVSEKIKVINNLINRVDYILIGGGMAFTFTKAQHVSVGSSIVEEDRIELAKEYLKKYSHKIILPIDFALSPEFKNTYPKYNLENSIEIPDGFMGLDIGPKTIGLFNKILDGAKTVIWNGPMGVTEFSHYKKGTEAVANIIAKQDNCFSIIGGGDSAAAIYNLGLEQNFSHISTGGGASLAFLEGASLPGVDAIQEQDGATNINSVNNQKIQKVDKDGLVVVKHPKLIIGGNQEKSLDDIAKISQPVFPTAEKKTNNQKNTEPVKIFQPETTKTQPTSLKTNTTTTKTSTTKTQPTSVKRNTTTTKTQPTSVKRNTATTKISSTKTQLVSVKRNTTTTKTSSAKTQPVSIKTSTNTTKVEPAKPAAPVDSKPVFKEVVNQASPKSEEVLIKQTTITTEEIKTGKKISWIRRIINKIFNKKPTPTQTHPNKSLPVDETKVIDPRTLNKTTPVKKATPVKKVDNQIQEKNKVKTVQLNENSFRTPVSRKTSTLNISAARTNTSTNLKKPLSDQNPTGTIPSKQVQNKYKVNGQANNSNIRNTKTRNISSLNPSYKTNNNTKVKNR